MMPRDLRSRSGDRYAREADTGQRMEGWLDHALRGAREAGEFDARITANEDRTDELRTEMRDNYRQIGERIEQSGGHFRAEISRVDRSIEVAKAEIKNEVRAVVDGHGSKMRDLVAAALTNKDSDAELRLHDKEEDNRQRSEEQRRMHLLIIVLFGAALVGVEKMPALFQAIAPMFGIAAP